MVFACKLWTPESWALESSIQLKEFLLAIGIHNPRSIARNPESSSWSPKSTAWKRESKTVLDYLTWSNGSPPQWGRWVVCTPLYTGFVPFFEQKNSKTFRPATIHFLSISKSLFFYFKVTFPNAWNHFFGTRIFHITLESHFDLHFIFIK